MVQSRNEIVTRNDELHSGKETMGGAANSQWSLHYPRFTTNQRAKVMTYVRIHDRSHPFRLNKCRGTSRLDLCAHPSILITDITAGSNYWRTINFYHDVDDPTLLPTLLALDLDPTIPTLLIGDFNTHSLSWSPLGWTKSHWADRVEEYLATQTYSLLSVPRIPTHRGEAGARDSTIDLAWANLAASIQGSFSGTSVSWEDSFGSDHALIRLAVHPRHTTRSPHTHHPTKFDTDLDAEDWDMWRQILNDFVPSPTTNLDTPLLIDSCVDAIHFAFHEACSQTMKKVGRQPARRARWWTDECRDASLRLQRASANERRPLARAFKATVRAAKRNWADAYISTANIWEVASWRHGRRSSHIPALVNHDGALAFDHEEIASLLSERFFAEDSGTIPLRFHDDPPPRVERPWAPFGESELWELLRKTKNNSAPGTSGVGWFLIKQGWGQVGELLTNVFNACIHLGHHPARWREAVVTVIPKPDKPDYSRAKAHRPISLLENMSKLMEKAVANRMQHDIVAHELIPTNQFGGRAHSSCLDAGMTLIHDVQTAHAAGLKVGIVLFDVKGFFDNVNHARMSAVLANMGFGADFVRWSSAFLKGRRVRLRFNNITSAEREQPVGVPQGSPLSPVFSITYTSSLLLKMGGWNNSSLGMYVDDGLLFACAEEWADVVTLLHARYSVCEEWLRRSGLAIEPDKTELLFFQKPHERNPLPAPTQLILPDPANSTYYVVMPSENIRYLGFFINRRLKWEPHVRIMCNRARASIKALQVLGNTVRGLSMANWRLVLNAVCLPVLAWGSQIWYLTGAAKTLIEMLQRVQNEMVKVVTGSFHTAPRGALLHFTRMLPMAHYIEKLTHTSALRLYRLPRASQLLRRLGPDWYVPGHGDFPLVVTRPLVVHGRRNQRPTALEALAARVPSWGPRVDVSWISPWEVPNWVAKISVMGVTTPSRRKEWIRDLTISCETLNMLLIHTAAKLVTRQLDEETVVGGAAAVFSAGGSPWTQSGWTIGSDLTQFDADVAALTKAVEVFSDFYCSDGAPPPPSQTFLLSSSSSAILAVTNPRSTKAHSYSMRFHFALTKFFLLFSTSSLILVWAPFDATLTGSRLVAFIAEEAAFGTPPDGLDRIQSAAFQKERARKIAFRNWERDYYLDRTLEAFNFRWLGTPPTHTYQHAIVSPPAETHHPLWREATKTKLDLFGRKSKRPVYRRHTTSTALQLAVDHAFTGSYATRFRPSDPPETLRCPCGSRTRDPSHIILDCPLFQEARALTKIVTPSHTLTLRQLMSDGKFIPRFLQFLDHTRAAARPPVFSAQGQIDLELAEGIG